VRDVAGTFVAIGPHASTTPRTTVRKLGVDVAVLGEAEEILVQLAGKEGAALGAVPSIAYPDGDEIRVQGKPHACDMQALPALRWEPHLVARHDHHHHRFEAKPTAPGAELEASRGCPYHCTFCAKENFRDKYRKRPLETVLAELDALVAQGVEYVYFVDEIFLPDEKLLRALCERDVKFGVQMRIDLFDEPTLDLLGEAGCVSIEAGVESISEEGRVWLSKRCRLTTDELTRLLVHAKKRVPFVQANLLEGHLDDPDAIERWREGLQAHGVWANKPVPLFPYPGSPDYRRLWGEADDDAWDRAHDWYLGKYSEFSDVQEARPVSLRELEGGAP
jgi:anaerobic magnesium-protoporphyrin IX monomethyl ester cyclase